MFLRFLQKLFIHGSAEKQSVVSIPVVNNKLKIATIYLDVQYTHGGTVTFEIKDSNLSEDELVDYYQNQICDNSMFISLSSGDKLVIVEKDKVSQFSIRRGSSECTQSCQV